MNYCEIFKGVVCLASNKPFDFGDNPRITMRIREFLKDFFCNCGKMEMYFVGSATLAPVYDLQLFVVLRVIFYLAQRG